MGNRGHFWIRAAFLLASEGCFSEPDLWELPLIRTSSTAAVHVRTYPGVSIEEIHRAALAALRALAFDVLGDASDETPDGSFVVTARRGEQAALRLTGQRLSPGEVRVSVALRPLDQGLAGEIHAELSRHLAARPGS
jgi:hypothetical protein